MSVSPPKDGEGAGDASPENSDTQMERGEEAQAREAYDFDVKEQDRWLPIANVARIMKTALPENAKIAKEAKECMQECVSEFISFITSEGTLSVSNQEDFIIVDTRHVSASEKCQQEKRKTVNGEDILFAMTSTGFENYAEALKIYLAKYRETQRGDNQGNQQRPSSSYAAAAGPPPPGTIGQNQQQQSATAYQGQDSGVDHILSPHGLDPSQQDGSYGGVYPPGAANNGVGGEHY
ncbi:MAG: hypothetical protein Q9164_004965 [Protoblastenia rupestris]